MNVLSLSSQEIYAEQELIVTGIIQETDFNDINYDRLLETAEKLVAFLSKYNFARPIYPLRERDDPKYARYTFYDNTGRPSALISLEATVNWGVSLNNGLGSCIAKDRDFDRKVSPKVETIINQWFSKVKKHIF